eukprot:2200508-Ditylum_brightwellii.AAC.1
MLLSSNQIDFLQDVIRCRDNNNNGMTRKEVIKTIVEMGRGLALKDKQEGWVIATQSTTTEQSQISITQQYCWHVLVHTVWEDMRKKNKPADNF